MSLGEHRSRQSGPSDGARKAMNTSNSIPLVDLRAQYLSIREEINSAIRQVVDETAFIGGSHVRLFEEAFGRALGTQHVIGVGNGTDAITIALKALGIGPGDAVATVANSFIASSEAITKAGALPSLRRLQSEDVLHGPPCAREGPLCPHR